MAPFEKFQRIISKCDREHKGADNEGGDPTAAQPKLGSFYVGEHQNILHLAVEVMLRSEIFYVYPEIHCPSCECDGQRKLYNNPDDNATPGPVVFACIRGRSERGTQGRETKTHSPTGAIPMPRKKRICCT